jgi:hypothetical protein
MKNEIAQTIDNPLPQHVDEQQQKAAIYDWNQAVETHGPSTRSGTAVRLYHI